MKRYALVGLRNTSAEQIARYLPDNYEKIGYAPHDADAAHDDPRRHGPCVVIEGKDNAGWTLDGYVIPRLHSGLIAVKEIDLSHPVMKTIPDTRRRTDGRR
jgi:hypothetical protein